MVFKPKKVQPDLAGLYTILNNSQLQTKNPAAYQVIYNLIQKLGQSQEVFQGNINEINDSINNSVNNTTIIINGIKDATVWTENDETAKLPSSVQVLAGTGITLDYTVPNKVTVNSSGSGGTSFIIMSNGDEPPQPMGNGDGDFLLIPFDYEP